MPQVSESQTAPHQELEHLDLSRIAQDLQIRKIQVESVVHLLDEGNTIPFITRYRKERTGGLNEDVLRIIQERVQQLRHLAERKQTILRSIEGQGKLTEALRASILAADNPKRLEDLYLPYKPKKRTLATTARERGLEPLALAIWNSDPAVANLAEVLPNMVNPEKELHTPDDVLLGVQHILAETVAETADVRAAVRIVMWDTGRMITTKSDKLAEGQGLNFKDYFQFTEAIRHIPPHRILAINRGEKENALQVKIEWEAEIGLRLALERLPLPVAGSAPAAATAPGSEPPAPAPADPETQPASEGAAHPEGGAPGQAPAGGRPPRGAPPHRGGRSHVPPPAGRDEALRQHPHRELLEKVAADALSRLVVPSLEREIRRELTQRAEGHAVSVFARNLRSKLLAAPLHGRRVLAIDPGFRTGCKVAALDEHGNLLEDGVIFPHPPQNKKAEAKARLEQMVRRHQIHVIAIGNGTACRETEEIVSEVITDLDARRRGVAPATTEAAPPEPAAPEAAPAPVATEIAAPASPLPESVVPPASAEAPAAAVPTASEAQEPAAAAPPAPEPTVVIETPPAMPEPHVPPVEAAVAEAERNVPGPEPATGDPAKMIAADQLPADSPAPPAPAPAEPTPPPEPLPEALPELAYVIVNEAGASVYSASPVGREEFPNFDATLRGTISIGRRLQDPLSELVKIDPQHVGVGEYQHDVSPKQLRESLEAVIESCVNAVGVDLNTASVPLLRHVSGLNQLVARDLVEFRKQNGPFRSREQLKDVPGIGEARWVQAAGFLKLPEGPDPLDRTWIHPESYPLARQLLTDLGYGPDVLAERSRLEELRDKLRGISPEEVAIRLQAGVPTVRDMIEALARPGRDPREDLPPPIFKKGILKLEDLQPGMELKGTVLNVVDFGAFIDVGLKDSGLVHISQMANRYVKSPYDVVAVGDVVNVWVLSVDKERHRVSLTMIQPGTERKPPERRPPASSGEGQRGREGRGEGREGPPQGGRPPRGGRRPPPQQGRGGPPQSRGGRPGGGPPGQRRGQGPPSGQGQQQGTGTGTPSASTTGAQQQPPPPPRKPRRQPPRPKLSQAALAGKESLNTFGELAAFWEAKKKEDEPTPPPPPPAEGDGTKPSSEG